MKRPEFSEPAPALLSALGLPAVRPFDPSRGVYSNRDLHMRDIELVGFDMDYTLAEYQKAPMEQLQYDMTVERLISDRGYPEAIRQLPYQPQFIIRGLVVDKVTGHLIKLDAHGRVWRAIHGRRALLTAEVSSMYRDTKVRLGSDRFASLDTLFAMPEACLYANLVEFFDQRCRQGDVISPLEPGASGHALQSTFDTWQLFDDVRNSIDAIHGDGSLKKIITADVSKYIVRDPDLALTLHKLRSAGKRLFLMTNSWWGYTDVLMRYLLDGQLGEYASWRAYFDITIVAARKPKFFTDREPFYELDTSTDAFDGVKKDKEVTRLDRSQVYQGGNIEAFETMANTRGERILYVGDHIYGDILRSRKDSLWRTCLIVEELESELDGATRWAHDIDRLASLDAERHEVDAVIGRQRAVLAQLEGAASADGLSQGTVDDAKVATKRLRREIDHAKRFLRHLDKVANAHQDELERRFNPYWGRLLKEHNELSRFGAQVHGYADTYTSRVTNFLQYSPVHTYRAVRELMSHDRVLLDTLAVRRARTNDALSDWVPDAPDAEDDPV